jgi:hypothetical protein
MIFEMEVIPNAAIELYSKSEVAPPRPTMSPCKRPSVIVFRIHMIPIGPMGTAKAKPIIIPLIKKMNPIIK